jgi:O-antigen/teichoic acid export membrane protein
MARLSEAGQDVRATIERGVEVVAVAVGAIVVGIAGGAAGLVPGLLGHRWSHVPAIVLWGGLALMISVPISSAAVGYLYAAGDARTVLRSVVAHTLTWVVLGLALLAPVGIAGIGVAWAAAAAVEVAWLSHAVKRRTGARPLARLALPLAIAVAAGGAGWAIASLGGRDALSGAAGLLAAEALFAGGLLALRPAIVRDAVSTVRQGLREARAR